MGQVNSSGERLLSLAGGGGVYLLISGVLAWIESL